MKVNKSTKKAEVFLQYSQDLVRFRGCCEGGETSEIAEQHSNLTLMWGEWGEVVRRQHLLGDGSARGSAGAAHIARAH